MHSTLLSDRPSRELPAKDPTYFQLMKTAATLLLMALGASAFGQTVLTNYFAIPPTNGCDGLGAWGPASALWSGPCTAPYTYITEPTGCAQGMEPFGQPFWQSGDTIYANLCSVPCTIATYDSSGDCVILCQLPGFSSVPPIVHFESPLEVVPNPVSIGQPLSVICTDVGPHDLTVTDAQGRVVARGRFAMRTATLGTGDQHTGLHLLQVRWPDGRTRTQRLLVQ